MEVLVRNAEGNFSDKDREYAASKLGKLDRYFHSASKVEMVHRTEKQNRQAGHRVEITVHADGLYVRGEEYDENIRAAIDKVTDKMETRLKRLKGRLIDRHRRRGHGVPEALAAEPAAPEEEAADHLAIAERKTFLLKPMSPDEAVLQLELIDHPFFVFVNEESGQVEVLYRRNDGAYGLLQPKR